MPNFHQQLTTELKKKNYSPQQLNKLKREFSQKYNLKKIPTNIEILLQLPEKEIPLLKKILLTKPTRTISGVAPVAIMTKPFECPHGKCAYCPGGPGSFFGEVPQSYTGKEPATLRAIRNNFDPYLQVFNRLEQYILLGHNPEKVELIIMGGTFPNFPKTYQKEFVKSAFQAMNDFSRLFYTRKGELNFVQFKKFFELPRENIGDKKRIKKIQQKITPIKNKTTLKREQKKNETAKIRCVALALETRPDYGLLKKGREMLKLGATRVEIGVQSVYDEVLKKIRRGHTTKETKTSFQILRDLGFKVAAHYMPGLPGVNKKKDLAGMKQLFSNPDYRPDMLKIYPCMVTKGTELYQDYQRGKFRPLTAKEAAELIVKFKKSVPEYCRIMRIQRDIPTSQTVAGVEMTNLRQFMEKNYNLVCRCIRCREPKNKKINWQKVKIKVQEYSASGGKEVFLSAEDISQDILIGFLRMRFPKEVLRKEITPHSALIRELHVYGTATGLGEEGAVQHRGWGKKLLKIAEQIARKNHKNKIVVISGVGAREYYRKLGYKKEGLYMTKNLLC